MIVPVTEAPDVEDWTNKTPRKKRKVWKDEDVHAILGKEIGLTSFNPADWHPLLTIHGRSARKYSWFCRCLDLNDHPATGFGTLVVVSVILTEEREVSGGPPSGCGCRTLAPRCPLLLKNSISKYESLVSLMFQFNDRDNAHEIQLHTFLGERAWTVCNIIL